MRGAVVLALAIRACSYDLPRSPDGVVFYRGHEGGKPASSASAAGLGPDLVFAQGVSVSSSGGFVVTASETDDSAVAVLRWTSLTRSTVRVDAVLSPFDVQYGDLERGEWVQSASPIVNEDGSLLVRIEVPRAETQTFTVDLAVTALALPAFTREESIAVPDLAEPSGIEFDDRHGVPTLWVVSDTGEIARVRDGEIHGDVVMIGGDLEAIRLDPVLESILVLDETTGFVRVFDRELTPRYDFPLVVGTSATPPVAGGNGFEGFAITAYRSFPFSADILVANQDDPHAIYRGVMAVTQATLTTGAQLAPVNVSEVVWDWGSRRAFVLHGYVIPNRLVLLDPVTLVEDTSQQIVLDEISAEGAAFAGNGDLWIANDTGGIVRYRWTP